MESSQDKSYVIVNQSFAKSTVPIEITFICSSITVKQDKSGKDNITFNFSGFRNHNAFEKIFDFESDLLKNVLPQFESKTFPNPTYVSSWFRNKYSIKFDDNKTMTFPTYKFVSSKYNKITIRSDTNLDFKKYKATNYKNPISLNNICELLKYHNIKLTLSIHTYVTFGYDNLIYVKFLLNDITIHESQTDSSILTSINNENIKVPNKLIIPHISAKPSTITKNIMKILKPNDNKS